jgi:hypothetical protein
MDISNILENNEKFKNIEDLDIFIKKNSNVSCDKFDKFDKFDINIRNSSSWCCLYNINLYPKLKSYVDSQDITNQLESPKEITRHLPPKFFNLEKYADKLDDISHSISTNEIGFTKFKNNVYNITPFEATQILVYQYLSLEFCFTNKYKILQEAKIKLQNLQSQNLQSQNLQSQNLQNLQNLQQFKLELDDLEETINIFYKKYSICPKINILYKEYILVENEINIDNLLIYNNTTFENNLIILYALKKQYTFELHHRILWSFYCIKNNRIDDRIGHLKRPLIIIERLKRIDNIISTYNNNKLAIEIEHLQKTQSDKEKELTSYLKLQLQQKEQTLEQELQYKDYQLQQKEQELQYKDYQLQQKEQELQNKDYELQDKYKELYDKEEELQYNGRLIQIQNEELHLKNIQLRDMANQLRQLQYNLHNG